MTLLDASTDLELQPAADVLAQMLHQAQRLGIEIMVVGATARDILIRSYVGSAPSRATADIDIGLAVSTWADVDRFTGPLEQISGSPHKFRVADVEVDVIPFGEIESTDRTITWSNDHNMDVFGFREAFEAAVPVKIPGGAVVAVASLPAQSLLKLFAWLDRRFQDRRDAIDLRTILLSYSEGPYFDQLYADHFPLLAHYDFDPLLAGAARMGSEARAIVGTTDRRVVAKHIMLSEELFDALISDMGGRIEDNRPLVSAYRDGLGEPAERPVGLD